MYRGYSVALISVELYVVSHVQVESQKLSWNTSSKVGSMDNTKHKPGGGEKKVNNCFAYVSIGSVSNVRLEVQGTCLYVQIHQIGNALYREIYTYLQHVCTYL